MAKFIKWIHFFFNFNCYWFLHYNFLSGSSITCWKIQIYSSYWWRGIITLNFSRGKVYKMYTDWKLWFLITVTVFGKYQYLLLYLSTLYLYLYEIFPKSVTGTSLFDEPINYFQHNGLKTCHWTLLLPEVIKK